MSGERGEHAAWAGVDTAWVAIAWFASTSRKASCGAFCDCDCVPAFWISCCFPLRVKSSGSHAPEHLLLHVKVLVSRGNSEPFLRLASSKQSSIGERESRGDLNESNGAAVVSSLSVGADFNMLAIRSALVADLYFSRLL